MGAGYKPGLGFGMAILRAVPDSPAMTEITANQLMHGRDWAGGSIDGWIAQEKFDGWRALWTGSQLLTRQGERICAPDWFIRGLPEAPLDCELYLGRGRLGAIGGMAWNSASPLWREAVLMVFDAPAAAGGHRARMRSVSWSCEFALAAPCFEVGPDIMDLLAELKANGGEGYMVREPHAGYRAGRSYHLLKVKRAHSSASAASLSLRSR